MTDTTQDVPDDQYNEGEPTEKKHPKQDHDVLCCSEVARYRVNGFLFLPSLFFVFSTCIS
jgi:hypothetical protein